MINPFNLQKNAIYLSICLLFFSCVTVQINQETQRLTTKKVGLANIGVGNELLLENTYKNTAIIDLNEPIRIAIIPIAFTVKTHKAFRKAQEAQPNDFDIAYVDSLPKSKFITFQIMDRVALIHELNMENNRNIRNYLSIQPDARIVTGISMALSEQDLASVMKADVIFLGNKGTKAYEMQLYQDHELIERIDFNQGVIFAYKTASFCWQENDRHQLEIVDVANEKNVCPDGTYSTAKRAHKEINYFKF